jgi:hypothetical protein
LSQRFRKVTTAVVDFGDATDGGEVFRGALQDQLELGQRIIQQIELDERSAECDARRKVAGMNGESCAAGLHRLLDMPCAATLFGELRKRNRRRIPLDPASQFLNPRVVGHRDYGTVTLVVVVPVRLWSSVTVNLTV